MANSEDTTIKTFEFKLRANKQFVEASERELEHSRQIYNAALAERISCFQITGASLGYSEQSRHLTEARTLPEVKSHLRTIQQDALERVDGAFKGFFRRVQNGEKPGFPRFKGKDRYHTFSQKYEKVRPCPIKGDKLTVPGVGSCRVRLSRPIEGQCKQLRITRRVDGWYALLVCETPKPEPMPPTGQSVGVDVGISSFATLSNGEEIENPRHLESALDKLQKQQRRLSRRQKGSKRRAKQRLRVAKAKRKNAADFVDRVGWLRLNELLCRRGRLMENSLRIMDVPVVRATRENTVEYGLFIGTDVPNSGLAIPFYKGSVEEGYNLPFECAGSAVVRSARISKRDGNVVWLERHLKMTQLFIGLGDQPFAMLLGKPNHVSGENVPRLEDLRCFVFPPGHGIMLHKGVWHDFPLAVNDPVTCLTMNSPEVVEALAGMKEPAEMDHGDVYKIDIKKRTGVTLFVNL